VQDATVVGADAVVAAPLTGPAGGTSSAAPAATPSAGAASSMSGADLALSDEPGTLREAPDVGALLPWIIAAYVLSIAAAGAVVLRVRGERERAAGREIREAVRSCIAAIKAAATRPSAGEAAPAVAGALRSLHRALAGAVAGPEVRRVEDAIASCEREGFDPGARSRPPAAALTTTALEAAGALGDAALRALARRSRAGPAGRAADAAAVGIALALAAVGATVASAAGEDARLAEARLAYARAMAEPARDPRVAAFARAEAIFREVADARPRCPDLLADWGNAAVGARDLGQAVLAYRRALALEPDLARARQNLGWLRAQMPSWVPRGARIGVSIAGPLGERSVAERLLFGALAFAAAALLAAPWGRAPRAMRAAAVLAALAWAATTASVILEPDPAREVVVLEDGVTLRSADSAGAPAVLAHALPAGVEASIVEDREGWLRLELADGARGWVPSAAIARVGGAKRGRAP
jgi:tetratricopeptide (TPR) repeat protein